MGEDQLVKDVNAALGMIQKAELDEVGPIFSRLLTLAKKEGDPVIRGIAREVVAIKLTDSSPILQKAVKETIDKRLFEEGPIHAALKEDSDISVLADNYGISSDIVLLTKLKAHYAVRDALSSDLVKAHELQPLLLALYDNAKKKKIQFRLVINGRPLSKNIVSRALTTGVRKGITCAAWTHLYDTAFANVDYFATPIDNLAKRMSEDHSIKIDHDLGTLGRSCAAALSVFWNRLEATAIKDSPAEYRVASRDDTLAMTTRLESMVGKYGDSKAKQRLPSIQEKREHLNRLGVKLAHEMLSSIYDDAHELALEMRVNPNGNGQKFENSVFKLSTLLTHHINVFGEEPNTVYDALLSLYKTAFSTPPSGHDPVDDYFSKMIPFRMAEYNRAWKGYKSGDKS